MSSAYFEKHIGYVLPLREENEYQLVICMKQVLRENQKRHKVPGSLQILCV